MASDKIGEKELYKIRLDSITNGCIKQPYTQRFDWETIDF